MLITGLVNGLKKAMNYNLRVKNDVIPSLVALFSSYRFCKDKYFLFALNVFIYKRLYLHLRLIPRLVVMVIEVGTFPSITFRGLKFSVNLSISRELKPSCLANEVYFYIISRLALALSISFKFLPIGGLDISL
jgi:hypothetical protein